MKAQIFLVIAMSFFVLGNVSAQEKNKESLEMFETDSSRTESLLNSKNFEFIANTALPTSGTPVNLVGSNYSVSFSEEIINSNLPYYGRAYGGMTMGRDKGMRFRGKPINFTLDKNKRGFEVDARVKTDGSTFSISLMVSDSGVATLSISSNDRGTISYQGEVISIAK